MRTAATHRAGSQKGRSARRTAAHVARLALVCSALLPLTLACGRETAQTPRVHTPEASPPTAAGDSCESTAGASAADLNEPFDTSSSEVGRLVRLHVPGMTCEGCAWQIRETVLAVPGVFRAHTVLATKDALIDYDPAITDASAIAAALDRAGYASSQIDPRP